MEAIGQAVAEGRTGDIASVHRRLLDLWSAIGVSGDPLHSCFRAHYRTDLYEDSAQALTWYVRALDAADAVTDHHVRENQAGLRIACFHPSLYLDLADDYHRLGSFEAATEHIDAAREHAPELPRNPYGDLVRGTVQEVAEAIDRRDRTRRTSAPGSAA
ncbi:hypothetical protein ACFWR4_12000 [Streptomyces hydrogenans]|uniref:hypothetical protein n=1 Tax=Streptomyces hydrogenans TaxID=1873719 RepID=UPI003662D0B3